MYMKKSEHGPQIPNAHLHRNNDDFVIEIKNGDWNACEYDHQWYIGEVIDYDQSDYLINYLEQSWKLKDKYRHPLTKGEI